MIEIILAILVGTMIGLVIAWFFVSRRGTDSQSIVGDQIKAEFQALSQDALAKASEQFLSLAEQRFARQTEAGSSELDTKKQLIDQQLANMNNRLEQVSKLVNDTETKRQASFSQMDTHLQGIGQQTKNLTDSTNNLREALSSTRARGQWGERMADDILRMLGFVEGINYRRQEVIQGAGSRPDFVFLLTDGLQMNMDVKFPFENYLKFLGEESEAERNRYKVAFLRDVRARIKEVTSREYINPEGGTVDYVLLFIPNESVYSFIHESDPGVIDAALESKVICCSPFTLFAVLAVVRQAASNFALQRASEEIISLFGRFNNEWGKFQEALDTHGRRLKSAQASYDHLTGTRKRTLERPLQQIESLRQQKGLPVAPAADVIEPSDEGTSRDDRSTD